LEIDQESSGWDKAINMLDGEGSSWACAGIVFSSSGTEMLAKSLSVGVA